MTLGADRIRNRLTLLFILIAAIGVVGSAFFTLKFHAADKHNYVMELNSVIAPEIAEATGRAIGRLSTSVSSLVTTLDSIGDSPSKRSTLGIITQELKDVSAVNIHREGHQDIQIVLDQSLPKELLTGSEWRDIPAQILRLPSGRPGAVIELNLSGHVQAMVFVKNSFFNDFFELSRGRRVGIHDAQGRLIEASDGEGPTTVPDVPTSELKVSRVVAKELKTPDGKTLFSSFSLIPGVPGQFIAVYAPGVSLKNLIAPVFRASSGFSFLVLVFAAAMGLLFSAHIAKPIEELTQAATQVATGQWKILLKSKPVGEIGRLAKAFSKMVTNLELRESELKEANRKLIQAESLASLGRFSAGIAHEVKNPLSSILGYSQLIQRLQPGDAKNAEYVKYIIEETRRASKIISDLLTFARQKQPVLVQLDVGEWLSKTREKLLPQAEQMGVQVNLESEQNQSYSAMIDPDQLYQVVLNLSQNAFQAMEQQSGRDKKLFLRLKKADKKIVLEIADTGPGISKENMSHLFEPFFSTKEVGKGTGLGLSLCHGIVIQHGGTIEVDSELGKGALFRISLPTVQ